MYPVTEEMAQNKRENDRQIQAVITGGDTVSYTHLDVYKRQLQHGGGRGICAPGQ